MVKVTHILVIYNKILTSTMGLIYLNSRLLDDLSCNIQNRLSILIIFLLGCIILKMKPESVNSVDILRHRQFESPVVSMAYDFAQKSHDGQLRKSGEPYFTHCVGVYNIEKDEWGIKDDSVLAADLLHDTVEDCGVSVGQLRVLFGDEVASLVSGVTKLKSSSDKETLRKFLSESYINPRVSTIKLADRLHNMRTLQYMSPEKQIEKSRETLDVYTKLAESLGIWVAKTELEDLSFKYLDPQNYQKTAKLCDLDPRLDKNFTCNLSSRISQLLADTRIDGEVEIRKSGYWILNKKREKMALRGKSSLVDFRDINDLVSFRVQLNTVYDCYRFLYEIHRDFGSLVDYSRFDEFIGANKRINGYQAIQTTINFPQGPVEVAIMTKEMEEFNNRGIVGLINSQKDLKDYALKLVFTPKGTVRFLPKNATGVDFAGLINPRVLAEAESINIDGVDCPLTVVIPNASVLRVNLGETRRAPLGGLEKYCLPQTMRIIQEQRILENRDNLVNQGEKILESLLIPRGLLVLSDIGDSINPLLYRLGCQSLDDLYFLLGNRSVKEELINEELNLAGITKENLKITTIRLSGGDKPRVLIDVVRKISDMNKNIVHIEQKNVKGQFNIRILVQDMNLDDENELKSFLTEDSRFSEGLVV